MQGGPSEDEQVDLCLQFYVRDGGSLRGMPQEAMSFIFMGTFEGHCV